MPAKDDYVREARARLEAWAAEMRQAKRTARGASLGMLRRAEREYREAESVVKRGLSEIREEGEPAWHRMREFVDQALERARRAVEGATIAR